MVARVSRSAAAVGAKEPARALADLEYLDKRLDDPKMVATLQWPHATAESGGPRLPAHHDAACGPMRAGSSVASTQKRKAIAARRAILEEQLKETNRVEIEREEMLAEAQLALNASQRHDAAAAGDLARSSAGARGRPSRSGERGDRQGATRCALAGRGAHGVDAGDAGRRICRSGSRRRRRRWQRAGSLRCDRRAVVRDLWPARDPGGCEPASRGRAARRRREPVRWPRTSLAVRACAPLSAGVVAFGVEASAPKR